jgi:FixJ family two-component response regulator
MKRGDHIVFVVDDDPRMCEALGELFMSLGLHARAFGTAADYLAFPKPDLPACLILDLELPDMSGLDLQKRIAGEHHPPIIFITGHGDIPSSVCALKRGAVDFLTKPFDQRALIEAICAALAQDRRRRAEKAELGELHRRLACLTPREREVLPLVVGGFLNKQAAAELGISTITVQIHRSKIMHKMEAASLADLVRIADRLRIPITQSRRPGGS